MTDTNQAPAETPPEPAPDPPPDRTYTESELNQRLRGQAKELEKLKAAATELEQLKGAQSEADRKAAAERGEYQKLYEEFNAKAATLEEQLKSSSERNTRFESMIVSEIETQVSGLGDDMRKRVKGLLDGRDVLDQREILSVFLSAQPAAPPPSGGAPGKRKGESAVDDKRFTSDPSYRQDLIMAALRNGGG